MNISLVSSAVIFSTTAQFGRSSSIIDTSGFLIWIFSHLIRGLLVGASNAVGSSCNRQDTFSKGDDNLKQIQATNSDPV